MATKKNQKTFKELFDELEAIVAKFEQGDVDLDASLALFERGLAIAQQCKLRLSEIENNVIDIKKKFTLPPQDSGVHS